jgi:hypothetical protein
MAAFPHHMKQDTSITGISHCIKPIKKCLFWFLYKQLENVTNKQPPWRSLLPHDYGCSTSQETPCLLEDLKGDYKYKILHFNV